MDKNLRTNPSPQAYDREYFESGVVTGVSGYMNYSWMPELTLRMVHYLIRHLPIESDQTILDYGCAKGFVVKALRILDYEAYGVDLSEYAIERADGEVRDFCKLVTGCGDPTIFERRYNWMIAKDVFEHIAEDELRTLLGSATVYVERIFAVIPLAADNSSGAYIVPEYDRDATHVIAKTGKWWQALFEQAGWNIQQYATDFPGCKENWTSKWPNGNGFFILNQAGSK